MFFLLCSSTYIGRICSSWLLSGPADGLVLLLADVLNLVQAVKWARISLCPAFMGELSNILYRPVVPARHA